jgi:NADH-quinone oxidoreductase subunit E
VSAPAIPPSSGGLGAAARAAAGAMAGAVRAAAAPEPVDFPPPALKEACDRLVERYPTRVAALLPVLHLAQRHYGGWVSPEVEAGVARYLDCSPAHVRGVLTFYAMYHTEPRGRHEVWVCRTLSCWLRGADKLAAVMHEKAGTERDGTNHPKTGEDGRFTVMEMECLGLCEAAPAVFVDGEPHVEVTPEKLSQLMDACE